MVSHPEMHANSCRVAVWGQLFKLPCVSRRVVDFGAGWFEVRDAPSVSLLPWSHNCDSPSSRIAIRHVGGAAQHVSMHMPTHKLMLMALQKLVAAVACGVPGAKGDEPERQVATLLQRVLVSISLFLHSESSPE